MNYFYGLGLACDHVTSQLTSHTYIYIYIYIYILVSFEAISVIYYNNLII